VDGRGSRALARDAKARKKKKKKAKKAEGGENALDDALADLEDAGTDDRTRLLRDKLADVKARVAGGRGSAKGSTGAAGVLAQRSVKAADAKGAAAVKKAKRKDTGGKRRVRSRSRRRRDASSSPLVCSSSEDFADLDAQGGGLSEKRVHFRRLAKKTPGRLAARMLSQFKEQLGTHFGGADDEDVLPALAVRYLMTIWLPQNPVRVVGEERFRELRTLAECVDLVVKGCTVEALDMLSQRLKACLLSIRDGHTRASRFLELLPLESAGSAVSPEEEELARKLESGDLKRRALATTGRSG
jgi:hypothetical protein